MSKLRVQCFGTSIDGFSAGPRQDCNPLGVSGFEIMSWFMETRYWKAMHGQSGGETGDDNQMAEKAFENPLRGFLGRNMFGPVRGEWPRGEIGRVVGR